MPGILLVLIVALIVIFPRSRAWLSEKIKTLSDSLIVNFLRGTSRFGSELTEERRAEQKLWREQRLRNLRGLALWAKEAIRNKSERSKS
jgi:serine/threonine-protein kinase RIO1